MGGMDWSKKSERNIKLIEGKSMKEQKEMDRRNKNKSKRMKKNEVKVK